MRYQPAATNPTAFVGTSSLEPVGEALNSMRRVVAMLAGMMVLLTSSFQQHARPESLAPRDRHNGLLRSQSETSSGPADERRRAAEIQVAKATALRRKQTARDFDTAIALLKESAQLFRTGNWYAQGADAYLQIGEIHFVSSRYDKALVSYSQALDLAGDREQRCQILSHIARTYANIGRSSEAGDYSKQALHLCAGLPDPKTRAEVLEAQGETLYWSGNSLPAAEVLSQARDLFAEAKDDDGQALALLMLAESLYRTEPRKSLQFALQASQMWRDIGNGYGVAQARAFLSTISAFAGQYETTLCYSKQARPIFEKAGDWDSAAVLLTTMGFVALQTGDAETSLKDYRQARAFFVKARDLLGEPETITGEGRALVALGHQAQLLPLYEAKLHLGQKTRNANLIASAFGDMAGVYEARHNYGEAEKLYRRALEGYQATHNPQGEGTFLIRLAHLYAREGKDSEAISLLQRAGQLKVKTGQVEELARIDYELALVYRRQGRLEEALEAIQKTVSIIESQRLTMAAFDSRASYFASVHKYYALYVQLLMLQSQNTQPSFMESALEASEKSKVRSLIDWLAGSGENASCDELFKRQAQAALTDLPLDPGLPSAQTFPALKLNQVQAEIVSDDAVLLEYALGDEKSYLWVVDSKQVSSHELPPAKQLSRLVQGLLSAVTAQQPRPEENNAQYLARIGKADRDYARYTEELSHLLLAPAAITEAKRIIVVPDGALQYVPFGGLPLPGQRVGKATLGTSHEVISLPSASALVALRTAVSRRPSPTAIAAVFADPVFDRHDPRVQRNRAENIGKDLTPSSLAERAWRDVEPSRPIPRLNGSHREAEAVRSLGDKGGQIFVAEGFRASRSTVLHSDLSPYRFIHFATHGISDRDHPERSGLILSLLDKHGGSQDGFLRLSDIYGLKLSADLVVLSSCDSGLGKDLSSEGIIGLPRAFLRAGAKSVIVTLWKVEDNATAKFMMNFYSHLRQGETPASALRAAQAAMSRDPQWSHPYYWAAFVLQGDYR